MSVSIKLVTRHANRIFPVPYYILSYVAYLYHTFPHYLINGTIFRNLLNIKYVF